MALASSSSSSSSSSCVVEAERVVAELSRGREIAERLRMMLRVREADSVFEAQSLVTQLLDTFTHSLTMLRDAGADHQAPQSEDSGDSCKTPPPLKDRRGCYKRKRNSETVIKESPNMEEDGHAWRKYGQKAILNAKHPRSYFRCTHKYEQGCQASKQVQKVQDNPPLYRTTYNGHHTCCNTPTNSLLYSLTHEDHHHNSPPPLLIWSFNTSTSIIEHQDVHKSPPPPPSPRDDYYMAQLTYSCSASASATISASDDNTNIDDISIDDFFELGTPLST